MFKSPEGSLLNQEEQKEYQEGLKNLKEFLRRQAEILIKEGVPVRPNCRIEMDGFVGIYDPKEIEQDKKEIERIESTIGIKDTNPEQQLGEQLEMLKTGIFNKFLSNDCVTVRASRFDDIKNGADNIIINRHDGSIVCALDEVGEMRGKRFEDKKEQVLNKNAKGGINLKYALAIEDGQILPSSSIQSVPIFYLALSPEHVRRGIQKFVSGDDKLASDYEIKIFDYFVSSIDTQIKAVELNHELNTTLKERIENFKGTIATLKTKKESIK